MGKQKRCCYTRSIANGKLDSTCDGTLAVARVVDRAPREGCSGSGVQTCCYDETPCKTSLWADVGDEENVSNHGAQDSSYTKWSSLLDLVAVPGATDVCQATQSVNWNRQCLPARNVSWVIDDVALPCIGTIVRRTYTWSADQLLPLRLIMVGRKTLKL